jgi:hypothetical protein
MANRYNAKGIIGIALGEMQLEKQPPEDWYSEHDERMPLLRIKTGQGEELYFCLTKSAVDNLIQALANLRELPVQKPRKVFSTSLLQSYN